MLIDYTQLYGLEQLFLFTNHLFADSYMEKSGSGSNGIEESMHTFKSLTTRCSLNYTSEPHSFGEVWVLLFCRGYRQPILSRAVRLKGLKS